MGNVSLPPARWRFGVFEVDPETGELRKQGRRIRIPEQSFQILLALLERPGEVVTRQQLQTRLWPGDTFVDFDANLNTAISLLREALGDSARSPRFIETLPRRGYRFLEAMAMPAEPAEPLSPPPAAAPAPRMGRWPVVAAIGLAVLALAGVSYRSFVPAHTARSIAVLPLVYSGPSGEGDQEFLADGLTSALITELVGLGVPNVISETSVMRYKGVRKPLPEIARELGADILVEGTVMREGSTVRINAQLIDARSDRHLWARSYQQELHSILALQDEVARAIVQEVRITLAPSARLDRPSPPRVHPQAHEAYLRGRHALRNAVEERLGRSREFFEQAIGFDPAYAPAYAGLADYYSTTDALPPSEALPAARRYALKALELDGNLAGAHLSLALASLWGDWDWAAAERAFRRSLHLNPGDPATRRWYALFLDLMDRPRAAFAQLQRVRELDPVSPTTYQALGYHFFLTRRYEESLEQLRIMQEMSPHDPMVFAGLGSLYVHTGAYDQAIAAAEEAMALWGRDPAFLAVLAVARARKGERDTASALLGEVQGLARQRHVPPTWIATIHMSLGDLDRAMASLETAFEARDVYLVHQKVSPDFDPVRGDARYQDLLRRMRFPAQADFAVTEAR